MTYSPASFSQAGDLLASGEETFGRKFITSASTMSSGTMIFSYWTARKTEACTKLVTITQSVAAAATPTLCRMGIYAIDSSGAGTLVASVANDTTLWNATSTRYSSSLSGTFSKIAGQRYATGFLIVTGVAAPNLCSAGIDVSPGLRTELASAPRIAGKLTSQSDLPSTFTDASLLTAAQPVYSAVLP